MAVFVVGLVLGLEGQGHLAQRAVGAVHRELVVAAVELLHGHPARGLAADRLRLKDGGRSLGARPAPASARVRSRKPVARRTPPVGPEL